MSVSAPLLKDHVQTAEAIPTRKAEVKASPANAAIAPASAHNVAPAPKACCQKADDCGSPKAFRWERSSDGSRSLSSDASCGNRNDFTALVANTAAITTTHTEFSRMKTARGASQSASSDVPRIRRRVSGPVVPGRIAHRPHTTAALARNTSRTFSTATPSISPGESVCTSGRWLTKAATSPAANSPPAGGSHLGNGRGAEVPTKSKAFILSSASQTRCVSGSPESSCQLPALSRQLKQIPLHLAFARGSE